MFIETWRAWISTWSQFARRRGRPTTRAARQSESLEGRFFLGQLSLPALADISEPIPEEAQVAAAESDAPDNYEELARAIEAVFRDVVLPVTDAPPLNSTEERSATVVRPIGPVSVEADSEAIAEEDKFDFGSLSDVTRSELLLESLKGGEALALGKAATRKAARAEKRNEKRGEADDAPAGLMVHDASSSPAALPNATGDNTSTTLNAGGTAPSGPAGGSINTNTSTGSSGTSSGGISQSIDQVMTTWGDLSFTNDSATSSNQSSTPVSSGHTYLSSESSGSEALASIVGDPQLSTDDVKLLLERASRATPSEDAIIAVVDRQGNILGIRTEAGVSFPDTDTLVFAIDGAVAKARTATFFSSDQGALTSRTVRFISQSTVTQREVESNPSITDMDSTIAGPGFVAPIGLGGHFPPNVRESPVVDLFGIEHTNRDTIDEFPGGRGRFDALFDAAQEIDAPGSFGVQSGLNPDAQPRGIATLPGGLPIYRDTEDANLIGDTLVGGIGVFFPGSTGYATYEQGFVQGDKKTTTSRTNAPKVLEAEFIAFVAAGGSRGFGLPAKDLVLPDLPAVMGLDLPAQRIDLAGITLEAAGPTAGIEGVNQLRAKFKLVALSGTNSGVDRAVSPVATYLAGETVPTGWLVSPRDSADGTLTAADVERIINQGIKEANKTRAAIRASPIGQRTKMVLSVTDKTGEVLGLYRMPDATYFSIDVAVAKARNVTYYADPAKLQAVDKVSSIPAGTALTSRTFRFLAVPRFPSGVDGSKPPPFSILNEKVPVGKPLAGQAFINKKNAENIGAAVPASYFQTVLGFDAFNIGRNFRDESTSLDKQNGVVFFPGSAALYKGGKLVGGLGVSGDGVDQDDGVTSAATVGFTPASSIKADRFFVNGVRLPYFKFVRNPYG